MLEAARQMTSLYAQHPRLNQSSCDAKGSGAAESAMVDAGEFIS
jgi:hypothetical protein